jgi:hypothetical protein
MSFMRDVWVNWFYGAEAGVEVCRYYEWRKEDTIQLIERIPVIKITSEAFFHLENGMPELPEVLLKRIAHQTTMRTKCGIETLQYCALFTDGDDVLAIDTADYRIPLKKSRLVPRHEAAVLTLALQLQEFALELEPPMENTSLTLYLGLTRTERELKQILLQALEVFYTEENLAALEYWCADWLSNHECTTFEQLWAAFYAAVTVGWTKEHVYLCEQLITGHSELEELWECRKANTVLKA